MLDVLWDAVLDSLKALPFLFLAYLLIEYLEHRATGKLERALSRLGPFGPVGGAVLGCIPQCGFSVTAANLYAGRIITAGTLLAVFVATSDEALPILLSQPEALAVVGPLLLVKLLAGIAVGVLTDLVLRYFLHSKRTMEFEELCKNCHCHDKPGILRPALTHTLRIFTFLLIVNLVLGYALYFIGEEHIASVFMTGSRFQPLLAALIGFIPNCGASILLTELYLSGTLSFGAAVAGLCTGAGVGLAVLFKVNRNWRENLALTGVLYVAAVVTGLIVNLISA